MASTARSRVFISYAGADQVAATCLADALETLEIPCFIGNRNLGSGQNFAVEIVRAITSCEIVVVLISENSLASPHVRREVTLAVDERRMLMPFALSSLEFGQLAHSEWVYWLSAVQVVDFRSATESAQMVAAQLAPIGANSDAATIVEVRRKPLRRTLPRTRTTPSNLLRAELDRLPLVGREQELVRLEEWAERNSDFDVRVLVADGGQGKTRLAKELADRLTAHGWVTRFLTRSESGRLSVEELGAEPTLIVVDYGETRTPQVSDLLDAALQLGLPNRLRLLLVARGAGDWWSQLLSRSDEMGQLLDGATVQRLQPLNLNRDEVDELYRIAFITFAKELELETAPPAMAPYREFPSALDLLGEALAHVLGDDQGSAPTTSSRILAHERRYLSDSTAAAGLGHLVDGVDLDRFTAALSLFGADDEDAAVWLLGQCRADLDQTTVRQLARLFRRLYPAADAGIEGLRPDALAEALLTQVIARDGRLPVPEVAWSELTPIQIRRGLYRLASIDDGNATPLLRRLLDGCQSDVMLAALEVVSQVQRPDRLVMLLLDLIAEAPIDLVTALYEALPDESVSLADLGAELARRLIDEFPDDEPLSVDQAQLMLACANRFSDAGWDQRAIKASELGVASLGGSAENTNTLQRGRALASLSNRYWETGQLAAAVEPARRAVELLAASPGHPAVLAAAQGNLAFRLLEVGRIDEAVATVNETRETWKQVAIADPERGRGYGSLLNNLCCIAVARGDFAEGAAFGEQAVTLRRRQAVSDRDRFLPYVARALANAAPAVLIDGRPNEGMRMILEARALHAVTGRRAPIFAFEEAESALVLGVMHAFLGDFLASRAAFSAAAARIGALTHPLADLTGRLTSALEHNHALADARITPDRAAIAPISGGASENAYLLPALLEYRDL